MKSIVCVGSIGLDTTRTPFKTVERVLGGSATYFALAARHFTRTNVVSVVGEDFPLEYWNFLEKENVDLSGVQRASGKTFFFDSSFDHALYSRKTNVTELNVFEGFKPVVPEAFKSTEIVYLGNLIPEEQLSVLKQTTGCKLSFMDTIEYYIKNDLENLKIVLKEVDGAILNDSEARMLSGESNLLSAGKKIQNMGPEILVIKKGEHGCLLFFEDRVYPIPAFPLENVVDPTGAGDSFAGGFVGFLSQSSEINASSLREAVAFGTIMGSFCVEDFSVNKLSTVTQNEINERLSIYKSLVSF
ncbi:MAG: PfkB family carbohydrate kinase [Candidatus Micrarchaeota archaeon]